MENKVWEPVNGGVGAVSYLVFICAIGQLGAKPMTNFYQLNALSTCLSFTLLLLDFNIQPFYKSS